MEALLAEVTRHAEPVIAVGKAHIQVNDKEMVLPNSDLNLINLYAENMLANNSVLMPRN